METIQGRLLFVSHWVNFNDLTHSSSRRLIFGLTIGLVNSAFLFLQLSTAGIDLGFYLDNTVCDELEKTILDNKDQIIDTVNFRSKVRSDHRQSTSGPR